ncbi:MAG: EAL domain-containing protein [Polyangia bacterium]|nr:EAL domain-containing protein [Polyangia bacterium]
MRDSVQQISSMGMEAMHTPTTLDMPRRVFHPVTGLVALTTLSRDVAELLAGFPELTIAYIHVPTSELVEDRYGWQAHEAYVGMVANFLQGFTSTLQRDRGNALLMHAFADDYVLIIPARESDERLEAIVTDGVLRHLGAMDPDLAMVSKVYVGMEVVRAYSRVHNERLVFRGILESASRAMDIGQRELMAQARILDRVLSERNFLMYFQPIVEADTARIFAYEALVRCQAKEFVSPLTLFDIAERSGRIRPLNQTLRQLTVSSLPELPPPEFMFINLHVDDFADPQMLDPPKFVLEFADRIVLEVTERAAILDFKRFKESLQVMRGHGFRIAIDDLGSGYSALNTLAEIVPEYIKFDMALIRGIDSNPVRQNLVRNMRSFADDLGVKVVAEGVETRAEYETVRDLGCHLIQGYYFARPAPPFVRQLQASASEAMPSNG